MNLFNKNMYQENANDSVGVLKKKNAMYKKGQ